MSWIDAVLSEFTRVTWQEWAMTLLGGFALAWLARLVSWYRQTK